MQSRGAIVARITAKIVFALCLFLAATAGALSPITSARTITASSTPLLITRPLAYGSSGADVAALQQFLKNLSYFTYPTITGYFGGVTWKAVAAFQWDHGLGSVGSVGPKTRALVATLSGASASAIAPATTATATTPAAQTSATTTSGTFCASAYCPNNGYTPGFGGGGASIGGGGGSTPAPDTTPPSVSLIAPSSGATVSGSSVTLSATASDNVAVASVQFKVDGTNIGSAVTSSPYTTTWNSTGVADGSHTLYAVAVDTSGNYATSSISITVRNSPPVISSISAGPGQTTAAVTWTTDENANSQVVYGATSAYGSAASSASLVTSHSIGVIGLTANSTYHYAVVSTDVVGNTATSTDQTFTTANTGPDVTPPTAPTNLTAGASSSSELDLSWNASTDNVGVAGYKIFRGGSQVGTTTSATTYADTGLTSSTTYTYFVKAYDAAGNISSASNIATSTTGTWSDGFANAPSGTPQFPNLLQGYVARASWRVAGVDYAVGIPNGTSLKDPSTISMSGVTVNASTHIVTVTGSNVTLNGYDFSLAGGWELDQNSGASNLTIENSNFEIGANNNNEVVQRSGAGSLTLLYDDFNGAGTAGSGANQDTLVMASGSGMTAEYNYFSDAYTDFIDIGFGNGSYTIKYNLFDAYGFGASVHADSVQTWGNSIASLDVEFNTVYQPTPSGSYPAQANSFVRIGDQDLVNGGSYNGALNDDVSNPVIAYNTTAFLGNGTANVFQIGADEYSSPEVSNLSIHDNFIDPTDNLYAVYVPIYGLIGTYIANPNIYSNTSMTSGTTLLAGQYNDFNAGVPAGPPNAPVISSATASSSTAILGGTAQASSTIDVYDGGTLLGTATATSGGTWSYTTGSLTNGSHTFTTKATDVYGNTGSLSGGTAVTIGAGPTISSISSGSPGPTSATITWNTTGDVANSKVVYGLTSSYGSASSSAAFVTSHSIFLSGLALSTTYHYAVVSTDAGQLTSTSTDQTFTTSGTYNGPGDVISGATAWWGLRGYDAAVSNGSTKAANICRASDSTCEDIVTLANGNFDASTASSFCSSTTCTVHTLYDQTGNSYNLLQATTAKQPQLTFNGLGSLPVITFGTTTYLCVSSAPTIAQPWTMSIAEERTASGVGSGLFGTRDSSSNDVGFGYSSAANTLSFGAPSHFSFTLADNSWHALQGVATSTGGAVYYDGSTAAGAVSTDGFSSLYRVCLGSDAFDDGNFTGAITEAGLWPAAFTSSQAGNVNSNQHTYWGF